MVARKIKQALEIAIRMHSNDAGNLLLDTLNRTMELRNALPEGTGGWLYKDAIRHDNALLIYRVLDLTQDVRPTKSRIGPSNCYRLDLGKMWFLFRFGTVRMFAKLLADGHLDPNQDHFGRTLLAHALRCRRRDIALLLLKHGAEINGTSDYDGVTALWHAVKGEFYRDVLWLIQNGAEPDFPKGPKKSPLQMAEQSRFSKTLYVLRLGTKTTGRALLIKLDANVFETYEYAWIEERRRRFGH